ncbi:anhydro-N-acetylmuramic acid kinase [Mangrovimonas sp. DI 80]|uniref:anhydro-N-acetylmuramic acid kinase n=1 Tax=Mangrovimonas sp. DI 80 TaxID=1779330 RepID=UPI0009767A27|nr:anhydro-N-acetylmuramic acid kinase [Mangrovimonas sp. DI 80]OMP30969.1 anhydro-N-acetylmuramic acid kinase [Mangrovimonas sp. DI 80]
MAKDHYEIIGVMSGTSLDGVDLIWATFRFDDKWSYKIHQAETVAYSKDWEAKLKRLVDFSKAELTQIDQDYTQYLVGLIGQFISKHQIASLDAVCSHGHTALHQPSEGLTYQIGNLPIISELLQHKVVCDFRVQDVELGGQGAPLVPIGDALLFSEYDFCLNLGGFANISTDIKGNRIAYDICPVNIVLNHYVRQLGLDYDDEGKIARSGNLDEGLLEQLNSLEFYQKNFPKSLGLEWVETSILPLIDAAQLPIKDVLRTFIEHAAIQIAKEFTSKSRGTVLTTGGGAYNSFLIERIQSKTEAKIIIPNPAIIEYKEALIFGFLGVLKLENQPNCLASVTGARHDHSSGQVYYP